MEEISTDGVTLSVWGKYFLLIHLICLASRNWFLQFDDYSYLTYLDALLLEKLYLKTKQSNVLLCAISLTHHPFVIFANKVLTKTTQCQSYILKCITALRLLSINVLWEEEVGRVERSGPLLLVRYFVRIRNNITGCKYKTISDVLCRKIIRC